MDDKTKDILHNNVKPIAGDGFSSIWWSDYNLYETTLYISPDQGESNAGIALDGANTEFSFKLPPYGVDSIGILYNREYSTSNGVHLFYDAFVLNGSKAGYLTNSSVGGTLKEKIKYSGFRVNTNDNIRVKKLDNNDVQIYVNNSLKTTIYFNSDCFSKYESVIGLACYSTDTLATFRIEDFIIGSQSQNVPVSSVSVSPVSKDMLIGDSTQLSHTVSPTNATNKNVTWTTNDSSVASVVNGLVVAKETGIAEISCISESDSSKKGTCIVNVTSPSQNIPVSDMSVSPSSKTLAVDESFQLVVNISPSNATNKNVFWESMNSSVVSVSSNGIITGISEGNSVVRATSVSNDNIYCDVPISVTNVSTGTPVESVSLDKNSYMFTYINDMLSLNATVLPTNATNKDVTWTSSNTSVATVNSVGIVTSRKEGTCEVVCTAKDGSNKSDKCNITVKLQSGDIEIESISLNPSKKTININSTLSISPVLVPSNATNKEMEWLSSNTSVATVKSGVVTGVSEGVATIICRAASNKGKMASCEITVTKKDILVTGVEISTKESELFLGDTLELSCTVMPSDATDKSVTYSSSNSNIITVSKNGLVVAKGLGSASVTVRTNNGRYTDNCYITVKEDISNNNVPVISNILVNSEHYNGSYILHYNAIDKDDDKLSHRLKIDDKDYEHINPIANGTFYKFAGTGLNEGTHVCVLEVSDGKHSALSEEFEIIIPTEPTSIKSELENAKNNYDFKHLALKNIIEEIISDGVFDSDLEDNALKLALNDYRDALALYQSVSQKAIDSIAQKKTDDLKNEFEGEIGNINGALGDLENNMNGVFQDGILSEAEKLSIKQNLQTLSNEKADIDSQYITVYENKDLLDPAKENLSNSYGAYVVKYNALTKSIDDILNKDGILDNSDRTSLNLAFSEHRDTLKTYSVRVNEAIDSIAKKVADDVANKIDEKYASILLSPDGIVSTVGKIESITDDQGNRLSKAESQIVQLADKITTTVSKDEVSSIITQSPDEISFGFNKISNYVTINRNGLTVNKGAVACDVLTTPPGSQPIIKLFPHYNSSGNIDTSKETCSIDATKFMESQGKGDGIRLKWDKHNYVKVREGATEVYTVSSGEFPAFTFSGGRNECKIGTAASANVSVKPDGFYFNTSKLALDSHSHDSKYSSLTHAHAWGEITGKPTSFKPSTHSHSGEVWGELKLGTSSTNYLNYKDAGEYWGIQSNCHILPSTSSRNLGANYSNKRWANIFLTSSPNVSSDMRLKENVVYINENKYAKNTTLDTLTLSQIHSFIKTDLKIAEYDYKASNNTTKNEDGSVAKFNRQVGFIAQDIVDTDVGKKIITKDEDGTLGYETGNFTSIIAGALKEEILLREREINELVESNKKMELEISELKSLVYSLINDYK